MDASSAEEWASVVTSVISSTFAAAGEQEWTSGIDAAVTATREWTWANDVDLALAKMRARADAIDVVSVLTTVVLPGASARRDTSCIEAAIMAQAQANAIASDTFESAQCLASRATQTLIITQEPSASL